MDDGAQLADAGQPMQVDSGRVLQIGIGLWLIALIVLLPFWDWLGRHDHRDWLWTCVAGIGLGLIGLMLVRKHRAEGRTS